MPIYEPLPEQDPGDLPFDPTDPAISPAILQVVHDNLGDTSNRIHSFQERMEAQSILDQKRDSETFRRKITEGHKYPDKQIATFGGPEVGFKLDDSYYQDPDSDFFTPTK
jgi:hypothetical protein